MQGSLLENQIAVVTGAAQGLGKEIAKALALEGARVALCDLNEERLRTAVGELEAAGLADDLWTLRLSRPDC